MRTHLALSLKTLLLLVLSLLTISLPLALFLFISHLHGIAILLIINLGKATVLVEIALLQKKPPHHCLHFAILQQLATSPLFSAFS